MGEKTPGLVDRHFSQPRALLRLFDDAQKRRLYSNIAEAMQGVPGEIVQRQLDLFRRIDPAYAEGVAAALAAIR